MLAGMRLALCSLLVALPVAAQPKPTVLEMRHLRSENLHIANQGGAMNWLEDLTLVLELHPGGKLVGRETGKHRKHDLYVNPTWTSEDLQTWTHRWSGTWKQTGAALALEVVLDDRKCAHTKTRSGEPTQQLACGAVTKRITFACTTETVALMTPTAAKANRDVWQCRPSGTVDLDRTPYVWTFAKAGCVKTLGGRTGFSYEPC
jgi:hypothetical protein